MIGSKTEYIIGEFPDYLEDNHNQTIPFNVFNFDIDSGGYWGKGISRSISFDFIFISEILQHYNGTEWVNFFVTYGETYGTKDFNGYSTYSFIYPNLETAEIAINNNLGGFDDTCISIDKEVAFEVLETETTYFPKTIEGDSDFRIKSEYTKRRYTITYDIPLDIESGIYYFKIQDTYWYKLYPNPSPSYGDGGITGYLIPIKISLSRFEPSPDIIDPKTDHQDDAWDKDNQEWTDKSTSPDVFVAGGGRYQNRLVVLGHNKVYVEGL